jgi:hypothetical protein
MTGEHGRRFVFRRIVGSSLVLLSVLSLLQSWREYRLWRESMSVYVETNLEERSFKFGRHIVLLSDDQPNDTFHSEHEWPGTLRMQVDGQPIGRPSFAGIRRSRTDRGRYHSWMDAWTFRHVDTGRLTLWLTRRIQPPGTWLPRFEVTVLDTSGTAQTRTYRAYQLGTSFPLYRSTQFLRWGESAFPLSTLDWVVFPLALLVFPFGTLFVGGWLAFPRR